MLSDLDRYLFDLQGYLILPAALDRAELASLNRDVDDLPDLPPGAWHGHLQREQVEASRGIAWQQAYELGPAWEALIDHPAWIGRIDALIGGHDSFDRFYGGVFIDENFISMRGPHQAIGLHSGGHSTCKRTRYQVLAGQIGCMQVNVLIALRDIGPGDGATVVIPGSHKANFPHPQAGDHAVGEDRHCGAVAGAIEVHLAAGDALLFTDGICHGSAARTNPGQRRIVVYRYSPAFTFFRFAYRPSQRLLQRLPPERRSIVWPFKIDLAAVQDPAMDAAAHPLSSRR